MAIASVVLCIMSYLWFVEAKAAAASAKANTLRMSSLQKSILQLRAVDERAPFVGERDVENSEAFISYAKEAGISEGQITSFERQPLKQMKNKNYMRDDIFLKLSNASIYKVTQLLCRCSKSDVGYSPTSVHLRAELDKLGNQEVWAAELLLTRVLFTATKQP
jgi:hypothetical protein